MIVEVKINSGTIRFFNESRNELEKFLENSNLSDYDFLG